MHRIHPVLIVIPMKVRPDVENDLDALFMLSVKTLCLSAISLPANTPLNVHAVLGLYLIQLRQSA